MPYKMKNTLRPATDHQKKLEAEETEYWIKYGERPKNIKTGAERKDRKNV